MFVRGNKIYMPKTRLFKIQQGRRVNRGGAGAAVAYSEKLLAYSPVAYWILGETEGPTADNAEGTSARDGTYSGSGITYNQTGIGDGRGAPLFNGSAGYVNIFSSSLATAMNELQGTLMAWIKVASAGVWTDAATRVVANLELDTNNRIYMCKLSANNTFVFRYVGTGVDSEVSTTALGGNTNWIHVAQTWSDSADEFKAFINGSQEGTTQTLETWNGGDIDTALIAALSATPTLLWNGYIAHVAVWNSPLTPAQIADLASV